MTQILKELAGSSIGYVLQLDAGLTSEQLDGEMQDRSVAGRSVVDRAWLCLGGTDEFLDRFDVERRVRQQHERRGADHRDRRDVVERIEWHVGV